MVMPTCGTGPALWKPHPDAHPAGVRRQFGKAAAFALDCVALVDMRAPRSTASILASRGCATTPERRESDQPDAHTLIDINASKSSECKPLWRSSGGSWDLYAVPWISRRTDAGELFWGRIVSTCWKGRLRKITGGSERLPDDGMAVVGRCCIGPHVHADGNLSHAPASYGAGLRAGSPGSLNWQGRVS